MGAWRLLPGELLVLISDFLQTAALSHLCVRTWQLLSGWHVTTHSLQVDPQPSINQQSTPYILSSYPPLSIHHQPPAP